jgi:hypothetical protein
MSGVDAARPERHGADSPAGRANRNLYNEGEVRLWPDARANGEHTIDVLRRLRAEFPDRRLILLGDGAPDHRARAVRAEASHLSIPLVP